MSEHFNYILPEQKLIALAVSFKWRVTTPEGVYPTGRIVLQNNAGGQWITPTPLDIDKEEGVFTTTYVRELRPFDKINIRIDSIPIDSVVEVWDVKVEKGNKATDWTPAPEDVQAEIDDAKQEALTAAGNAQNTANSLKNFTDTAFRDGIIDRSESVAIEKYKNSLNEAMAKAEASYNKVYTNTYLEGTAKTSLLNAKINLWGQRDTLLSAINTAISGGTTTPAQKTAVDNAFTSFNSLMSAFQSALEEANKAIQAKLDDLSTKKVNNIEIGGRNYFTSTTKLYCWKTDGSGSINLASRYIGGFSYNLPGGIETNLRIGSNSLWSGLWTMSFDIISSSPNASFTIDFGDTNLKSYTTHATSGARKHITYSANNTGTYRFFDIAFGAEITDVSIENLKIERGNKATDWTPAPEDIQYDYEAKIKNAADSISLAVYNKTLDELNPATEIKLTPSSIKLTVADDIATAKNAAISAAATDATTKANNAKNQAISVAATDATNKVNGLKADLSGTGIDIEAGILTLYSGVKGGNAGGKVIIAGDNFSVDANGKLKAVDGEFSGKITATSGVVGGFLIGPSSLVATNDDGEMLLSSDLIRFTGQYSEIAFGNNVLPMEANGDAINTPITITVNRPTPNQYVPYGNIGLWIDVTGVNQFDDAGMQYSGNNALYITRGTTVGFRPRVRRVNTSQTLSTLDTVIFCVAQSAKITLTLPTNAEDGQIYFIKKATSPDFVVTAGGRDYIMTNSSTKSITVSNKHLIILIYDKVNGLWMFGLANE